VSDRRTSPVVTVLVVKCDRVAELSSSLRDVSAIAFWVRALCGCAIACLVKALWWSAIAYKLGLCGGVRSRFGLGLCSRMRSHVSWIEVLRWSAKLVRRKCDRRVTQHKCLRCMIRQQ
jgi:hypothetical protein